MSLWTTDNPIFKQYLLYAGVTAIKLLLMGPLTARQRLGNNVFANDEDAKAFIKDGDSKEKKAITNHPGVERVRRAHLNDLENIPLFFILGLLFVETSPCSLAASICYKGFTIARIVHTICYLNEVATPRGLSFMVGTLINAYMAGCIVYKFAF